jgi:hypothetical protein
MECNRFVFTLPEEKNEQKRIHSHLIKRKAFLAGLKQGGESYFALCHI